MFETTDSKHDRLNQAVQELQQLHAFAGSPAEFWASYLKVLTTVATAELGMLVVQRPEEPGTWKRLSLYPPSGVNAKLLNALHQNAQALATDCMTDGAVAKGGTQLPSIAANDVAIGTRVGTGKADDACVALFLVCGQTLAYARESMVRLQLLANFPINYQFSRAAQQAQKDLQNFSAVLDMMVLLNAEKRYLAATMRFCNELASRFHCDRVSLGWLEDEYVRLQSISHMERFNKKMDIVKKLEVAMEEALDQDLEIVCPRSGDDTAVIRDHEGFAKEQGVNFICSLPLRLDRHTVGVVTCERNSEAFSEFDVRYLRIYCDQAVRLIGDLKKHDRWFGARWVASARDHLSKLVGVEHTWAKTCAVIGAIAVAILLFGRLTYRVEAKFTLQSETVAFLPAPFDGYIDRVAVKLGDEVREGDTLLRLGTHELLLEEAAAIAEKNRYLREVEKARAESALSEMRVSLALAEQASSRLDLIRHRLSQADIESPFAGVLVEGDLKDRIGAPVKTGEVLFKVARLDDLYLDLNVDERDIHEIRDDCDGQIAFASRPKEKFPVRVVRIEPAATAIEGANIFTVRCQFTCDREDWWRPGMTGVGKLNIGKRNIFWIFTHRTIDFLRIFFWW